jgi:hypothetical protein
MNFRVHLDSAHASNIHPLAVPQQSVRPCEWRRGWITAFGCMVDIASIAAIFAAVVRPKHPPLWRTKFVGFTAFRFWASTPRCCGR